MYECMNFFFKMPMRVRSTVRQWLTRAATALTRRCHISVAAAARLPFVSSTPRCLTAPAGPMNFTPWPCTDMAGTHSSWFPGRAPALDRAQFEARWCAGGVIAHVRQGTGGGRDALEFRLEAAGGGVLAGGGAAGSGGGGGG